MPERHRGFLTLVAGAFVFCGGSAHAIIIHPVDGPAPVSAPPAAVVGRWNVDATGIGNDKANASAVAIGPNHIITTRHQLSGGLGSIVEFGGTRYKVAEIPTIIDTADLRVMRITKEDNSPANLANFTPIFTGDDDPALPGGPYNVTLGGFGRPRGTDLTTTGGTYGYNWDFDANDDGNPGGAEDVNDQLLRFGRNTVELTGNTGLSYAYPSDLLAAFFDGPNSPDKIMSEASVSEFDSGGGWFVDLGGGQWRVAALTLGIGTRSGTNSGQPSNRSLFASHLNANNAEPDLILGVRLGSYADEIAMAVPEPTSGLMLLGAGMLAVVRRTRRAAHAH